MKEVIAEAMTIEEYTTILTINNNEFRMDSRTGEIRKNKERLYNNKGSLVKSFSFLQLEKIAKKYD